MKYLVTILLSALLQQGSAQIYYNDVWVNKQGNNYFQQLVQLKIKQVKAINYLADGKPAEGFSIEQNIDASAQTLETITEIPNKSKSVLTSQFEKGILRKTKESVEVIETNNLFEYNNQQLISRIYSTTSDTSVDYATNEEHIWQYTNKNQPLSMLKIKNKKDTTYIEFKLDAMGNVAEEHWFYKNREFEIFYYYYNDQNLLTDIVKYNAARQKIVPEMVFEYDLNNRLVSMTQFKQGGTDYFVWKYDYAPNQLKLREWCYDKNQELIGKIAYEYR